MSKFEADRLKVQQLPHLQETPGQQQVRMAASRAHGTSHQHTAVLPQTVSRVGHPTGVLKSMRQ